MSDKIPRIKAHKIINVLEKMGLFEFVKAEVIKSIRAKKEKGLQSHITRGRFFILKL
jgi:predicted transcriptional regulator